MPIEPKRIEAAASVIALNDPGDSPDWEGFLDIAKAVLAAAFPELMSDPPTAWVAPVEPSEEIAAWLDKDDYWQNIRIEHEYGVAMRDAHTKEQT